MVRFLAMSSRLTPPSRVAKATPLFRGSQAGSSNIREPSSPLSPICDGFRAAALRPGRGIQTRCATGICCSSSTPYLPMPNRGPSEAWILDPRSSQRRTVSNGSRIDGSSTTDSRARSRARPGRMPRLTRRSWFPDGRQSPSIALQVQLLVVRQRRMLLSLRRLLPSASRVLSSRRLLLRFPAASATNLRVPFLPRLLCLRPRKRPLLLLPLALIPPRPQLPLPLPPLRPRPIRPPTKLLSLQWLYLRLVLWPPQRPLWYVKILGCFKPFCIAD